LEAKRTGASKELVDQYAEGEAMTETAQQRVLIVEDEMLVAILLEDMLAELGFEVAGTASRVANALPLVDTLTFDIAILDVNLAGEESFPIADALAEKGCPMTLRPAMDAKASCRATPTGRSSASRFQPMT
jgi:CheY-like chemotaxis protein